MSSYNADKSSTARNKNNNDEGLSAKGDQGKNHNRKIKRFPKDNIKPENNPFTPEGLVQCLLNDNQLTRKAIALLLQELQNIEGVLQAIKNRGYL